jgi:hypothetical protein
MARFTNVKYADTHLVYGISDGSTRAASGEYQRRYPDRRQHNRYAFGMVHCVKETGGVMPPAHVGHSRRSVQNDEKLLVAVHASPSASTGCVAYATGLPQSTIWYTLHEK